MIHRLASVQGEKGSNTYSVISTSQAKSAMEPVVESTITYMINRQTTPSNSEELLVNLIYFKKEKRKKRTRDNNLPFPSDGFLPLSSSPVIQGDKLRIRVPLFFFQKKKKKRRRRRRRKQ
jgi:hypothetical protein